MTILDLQTLEAPAGHDHGHGRKGGSDASFVACQGQSTLSLSQCD